MRPTQPSAHDKASKSGVAGATAPKPLTPAAERALAEAASRRAERDLQAKQQGKNPPGERDGRGGLDPVRYGDWEVKGIASDF